MSILTLDKSIVILFRLFATVTLTFVLFTFCKSPYKTSSATLPHKDRKSTVKQDQKELKEHMEKQEQKVQESEDIEHKYVPANKRKKRGEIPVPETYY